MPLHRRVQIAEWAADPEWSVTQSTPAPADLVAPIVVPKGATKLLWWAVGYDGDDENARPANGDAITYDAAIVFERPGSPTAREYVRLPSIVEESPTAAEIAVGIANVEVDVPEGCTAWVQMIALTPAGELDDATATHLWFSYDFR